MKMYCPLMSHRRHDSPRVCFEEKCMWFYATQNKCIVKAVGLELLKERLRGDR